MESTAKPGRTVVICGTACQLAPDVNDARTLFEYCSNASCSARPIPASRWKHEDWYHPSDDIDGCYHVQQGSYLERDVAAFDAPFFGISEVEAQAMDPQERLLLECAYNALENAGLMMGDISGREEVGVFASASQSDYSKYLEADHLTGPKLSATGTAAVGVIFSSADLSNELTGEFQTMFGNRISYFFNLRGPSVTVDTACSSGLTALDMATNSIRSGRCEIAIVGGSFLQLSPATLSAMDALGVLSPQGKSLSFDARGDGYGRGEGVACVILMSSKRASECNHPVRATVRATAVNHCGRSQGITSPDGAAQTQLIRHVYAQAGLDPRDSIFVEAHGTGTRRGDETEILSIADAFNIQERSSDDILYIGSAKSNFGHTEATSGLVSVIKCILMLERGIVLPNANFEVPNPALRSYGTRLAVPTVCIPWPSGAPLRISINNFGFGGSNAHVILEREAPAVEPPHTTMAASGKDTDTYQGAKLFSFSARDKHTLALQLSAFADFLKHAPSGPKWLRDLSYTLNCRRTNFPWQAAVVALSVSDLQQKLQRGLVMARRSQKSSLLWVFTGQGSAWPRMTMSLLYIDLFADTLKRAEAIFKDFGAQWSLIEELSRPSEDSRLTTASISQPAVTAVQVAFVVLLRKWGLAPSAVTGHSSGEIAAAFAAGALGFEACLAIAYHRGAMMESPDVSEVMDQGAMLAVGAPPSEVQPLIASLLTGLASIACYNSPSSVTVSGDKTAIAELERLLLQRQVFHRRLGVDQAYHSDHMLPYVRPYHKLIDRILRIDSRPISSDVRYYSSVSGSLVPLARLQSAWHWVSNLASPVRFSDAFTSMLADVTKNDNATPLVVEIGPHKSLSGPIKSMLSSDVRGKGATYCSTLTKDSDAVTCILETSAMLMNAGKILDAKNVYESICNFPRDASQRCLVDLPKYPFNLTRRYWHESRFADGPYKISSPWNVLLGHRKPPTPGSIIQCRKRFALNDIPWLRDHVVNGSILFPMAGYICAVIEALDIFRIERAVSIRGFQLLEVAIPKALPLMENERYELWTTLYPHGKGSTEHDPGAAMRFQVSSWSVSRGYVQHCNGIASLELSRSDGMLADQASEWSSRLSSLRESAPHSVDIEQFYRLLKRGGLDYGHHFRRLSDLWTGSRNAFGTVSACDATSCMPGEYEGSLKIHPALLDAALHVGALHMGGLNGDPSKTNASVPVHLSRLFVSNTMQHHSDLTLEVHSYGTTKAPKSRSSYRDYTIFAPGSDVPLIQVDRLESLDQGEAQSSVKQSDLINPQKIVWHDHPDCVDLSEFVDPHSEAETNELRALERASLTHMSSALRQGRSDAPLQDMTRLHDWVSSKARAACTSSEPDDPTEHLADTLSAEVMVKAGNSLYKKLYEGLAPSEIPLTAATLAQLEEGSVIFRAVNRALVSFVARFALLQPSMRILQCCAGAGRLAFNLLGALTSGSGSARLERYDFTDVSPELFTHAQGRLSSWQEKLDFGVLDPTDSPANQGFDLESYDLVLGTQSMFNSLNAVDCVRGLRTLLKPNGVLVLAGMTGSSAIGLPFAMFTDTPPWRSREQWTDLLRATGLPDMQGFWQDDAGNCLFWTRKIVVDPSSGTHHSSEPLAIVKGDATAGKARELRCHLLDWNVSLLSPDEAVGFRGVVICLEDPKSLSVSSAEPAVFQATQNLLLSSKKLVYITSSEYTAEKECMAAFALGFGRVFRGENAGRGFVVLQSDLRDKSSSSLGACLTRLLGQTYFAPVDSPAREWEFRQRGDRLQFVRLVPDEALYQAMDTLVETQMSENVKLRGHPRGVSATCDQPGTLNSLYFAENGSTLTTESPGEDEVLVQVDAVGINFKDLLITLGRVPWELPGKECAATVLAAGARAKSTFAAGDRVVHWGHGGLFSNRVRCHTSTLAHIPDGMSMQEAASIPLVFATAYECLTNVARLQEGERVLIHAASGGVGQAAIMISQRIGAEIYCTVSTPEKRDLIVSRYGIPSHRIFSSRSVEFAEGLTAATGRKGVDVVINSLANEMLKATWNCIATHGRFVEIGKRDALVNSSLDMAPFARGASYCAVDLNITIGSKPKAAQELLRVVMDLFKDKHFRPVYPLTVYPFGKIHDALRNMQKGQHVGKLVLELGREEEIEVRKPRPGFVCLLEDASYIVVGGTGGLGRALVEWMVERGARHIHLLSRTGNKALHAATWAATLDAASGKGATIAAHNCDVSELQNVRHVLAEIVASGEPPVKGVIQSAMVLRGALYESTNPKDWAAVATPKIQGAFNLHKATLADQLDFFVCFSSISALGLALGQSSYAASNGVLDAFCDWRTRNDFPASSIGLPVIADAGYVAENAPLPGSQAFEGAKMAFREVKLIVEAALTKALFKPEQNSSHTLAGLLKSPPILPLLQEKGPLFSVLRRDVANVHGDTGAPTSGSSLTIKALVSQATSRDDTKTTIANALIAKIASMMSVSPEDITIETSLGDLGIDSLVAVEIRNWMSKELEAAVAVMEIIGTASVVALAELAMTKSPLTVRFASSNLVDGDSGGTVI